MTNLTKEISPAFLTNGVTMKISKTITILIALAFVFIASISAALAAPAQATTAVNVRSGPGVGHNIVSVLLAGENVNVTQCEGNWCYVEKNGPDGWVSGKFLAPVASGGGSSADAEAIKLFGNIFAAIIGGITPPPPPAPPAPPPPAPPAPVAQLNGVYTVVQKSSGRYLDAHGAGPADWSAVTRPQQFNATQAWIITPLGGGLYTMQQQSNGRYLDAHGAGPADWSAVTRPNQNNNTQRWILTSLGSDTYTIQQKSNNRYLDAHMNAANDWSAVTRPNQNNNTQRWIIK